jgi:hypothetical protein
VIRKRQTMRTRTAPLILMSITAVLLLYMIMYHDTDEVMDQAIVLMSAASAEELPADVPGAQYDRPGDYDKLGVNMVDVTIRRYFVLHNFSRGYMWIYYDLRTYNPDQDHWIGTSSYACWTIQKVDGTWRIVDIEEGP